MDFSVDPSSQSMEPSVGFPYPLIVDSDPQFIASIQKHLDSRRIPPVIAATAAKAENCLSNPAQSYSAIFLNPIQLPPGGVKLIELARYYHPSTPLFLLYDREPSFSISEMNRMGIEKTIEKPVSYDSLLATVKQSIPLTQLVNQVPQKEQVLSARFRYDTQVPYVAVPVRSFFSCGRVFFDVFVKLKSGRFVKVLKALDSFTPSRLEPYLQKGLTHFYLQKSSHQRCFWYTQILGKALLRHKGVSSELKATHTLNEMQGLLTQIRKHGVTPKELDHANDLLYQVQDFVGQLHVKDRATIGFFLSQLHAYEHAVGTALVAALLTRPLSIETFGAFHLVGLASLLHDIGLDGMPEHFNDEDLSTLTPPERELYKTHPLIGAQILQQVRELDPLIIQAVAQHHERRNNQGFPKGSKVQSINRIAEIVGISDEFVRLLRKKKRQPTLQPIIEMQNHIFDGFSYPIVEAFRSVFGRG